MTADIDAAVAAAVPDPMEKVDARAIGPLLGLGCHFYLKSGNRRRLEADGFPRSIARGRWLKRDVVRFLMLRSRGLPTAPVAANDEAAAESEPIDAVIARTRQHLRERRGQRRGRP